VKYGPRLRHTEGEPLDVNCAKMKRDVVAPGLGT